MATPSEKNEPPPSSTRKRLGEIAIEKGHIDADQLSEALKTQQTLRNLGIKEPLGEILVKRNQLSKKDLEELLQIQARLQKTRRLGNYELFEKIGAGAMGVVFRARQISMNRIVALKVLAPKYTRDKMFIDRFQEEARAAGRLNHKNIVIAFDVGKEGPYYFLAMEYVDGEELGKQLRQRGTIPEKEALSYTRQIAEAMEHAWQQKFIHRDIKPDNVMITAQGEAKLLDMGLACTIEAGHSSQALTKKADGPKRAFGTPHYISPEAARGDEDLDPRADIYSLGCTLFHLLTGSPPFKGASADAVMVRHLTDPLPDVRKERPIISEETAALVSHMTAKKREDRYNEPADVIAAIDQIMAKRFPEKSPNSRLGEDRRGPNVGPSAPQDSSKAQSAKTQPKQYATNRYRPVGSKRPKVTTSAGPLPPVKAENKSVIWIGLAAGVLLPFLVLVLFRGCSSIRGPAEHKTEQGKQQGLERKGDPKKETDGNKPNGEKAAAPDAKESKDAGPDAKK